ncbi:MAG TPA: nucleoside-diphosphate sugar epimerase/dehydratase, partial [Acidimicrobiales bacterium]
KPGFGLRAYVQVALDCVALALGIVLALLIRFDGTATGLTVGPYSGDKLVRALVVTTGIFALVELATRWIKGRLRYGTFEEQRCLVFAFVASGCLVLMVNSLSEQVLLPTSVIIGGFLAGYVFSAGLRLLWLANRQRRQRPGAEAEPVIVFGAGDPGEQTVNVMLRDPLSPYRPVAVLDDEPAKQRYSVLGVRVAGGRARMGEVAQRFGAKILVIALPEASSEEIRELAGLGVDAGLEVRVLPPVAELFGSSIALSDIRPVTDADLLGRDVVETDLPSIAGYLQGRRVLVTGAGGSIGSEICRRVAMFDPAELVMLDRDESALHALQLGMDGRAMLDSRNLVVADIRDRQRMFEVFAEHEPHVVFHAAALKHLPLLEMHPREAVKSNVYGTLNVLDAAGAADVTHFVNISTDKAADPCSILGYSKRVAEGLTSGAARRYPGTYLSVRFGNVLGSRGSVLTAFHSQVASGGPITVTDPDVTRYFMTISEAVQLVVQAGAVGDDGEALVLDMGEPVRIADVARQLAAQAPRPIEIVYTGLRQGEKLHEVLLAEGEVDERPAHPLISHVPVPALHPSDILRFGDPDDFEGRALLEQMVVSMEESILAA